MTFFILVAAGAIMVFQFTAAARARNNLGTGPMQPSTRRNVAHITVQSAAPREHVRAAAEAAIVAAGGKLAGGEPLRVSGVTGSSMRSYGQVLTVWLTPTATGTEALVESKPALSTTLFDFGATKKSARTLATTLEQVQARPAGGSAF